MKTFWLLFCVSVSVSAYGQTDCEKTCNLNTRQGCINRCSNTALPKQSVFQMTTGQRRLLLNSSLNGQLAVLAPDQSSVLQSQLQEMEANKQSVVMPTDTAHAALNAGASQGQLEAAKNNYQAQFGIVKDAVQNQAKPRAYSGAARAATLEDPFQEQSMTANSGPDEKGLADAVQNSCLAVDPVNKIAKVGHDCSTVCKKAPAVGLYPLFPDGSFIDSTSSVKRFFALCASPDAKMAAVTADEQIVAVN
jgi:hypothetical protein